MELIIELRAAEGGIDAKLLTKDLANAYTKLFNRKGWTYIWLETRECSGGYSLVKLKITGNKDILKLKNEVGGSRFQRVPPTEKRGRVHTSTVTVAVLGEEVSTDPRYDLLNDEHFYVEWFSGTGKGGQHRNKHQNSCRYYHLPTGIVESRQGRSRTNNLKDAKDALLKTLALAKKGEQYGEESSIRKSQVGSGMRGDKIVTVRFQDDTVSHHTSNKSMSAKKYMRGYMDSLWS